MASSDVCSVVAGASIILELEASDVHAVWQAWAVLLMSWSSRNRDCVCACEPYTMTILLIHREGQELHPSTPTPVTHPVLTTVALRHRSQTNVAFLSRLERVRVQRAARGEGPCLTATPLCRLTHGMTVTREAGMRLEEAVPESRSE